MSRDLLVRLSDQARLLAEHAEADIGAAQTREDQIRRTLLATEARTLAAALEAEVQKNTHQTGFQPTHY